MVSSHVSKSNVFRDELLSPLSLRPHNSFNPFNSANATASYPSPNAPSTFLPLSINFYTINITHPTLTLVALKSIIDLETS